MTDGSPAALCLPLLNDSINCTFGSTSACRLLATTARCTPCMCDPAGKTVCQVKLMTRRGFPCWFFYDRFPCRLFLNLLVGFMARRKNSQFSCRFVLNRQDNLSFQQCRWTARWYIINTTCMFGDSLVKPYHLDS
jgi:hypothetical protein